MLQYFLGLSVIILPPSYFFFGFNHNAIICRQTRNKVGSRVVNQKEEDADAYLQRGQAEDDDADCPVALEGVEVPGITHQCNPNGPRSDADSVP